MAVACLLALTAAPVVLFAWLYRPDPATEPVLARAAEHAPGRADGRPADRGHDRRHDRPARVVESLAAGTASPFFSRFEPLVGYLPGVWLSGSLATLALLATGLVGVERLRRSSRPLEADAIAAAMPGAGRLRSGSPGASAWRSATGSRRPSWSASCGR